jgi:hypothetical protein
MTMAAHHPAISRRSDFLVEHRHGVHALQYGQGQLDADQAAAPAKRADAERVVGCQAHIPT